MWISILIGFGGLLHVHSHVVYRGEAQIHHDGFVRGHSPSHSHSHSHGYGHSHDHSHSHGLIHGHGHGQGRGQSRTHDHGRKLLCSTCDDGSSPAKYCTDTFHNDGNCYSVEGGTDCNTGGGPTDNICVDTCAEPTCAGEDDTITPSPTGSTHLSRNWDFKNFWGGDCVNGELDDYDTCSPGSCYWSVPKAAVADPLAILPANLHIFRL